MTGTIQTLITQSEFTAGVPWNVNYRAASSSCLLSFGPAGQIVRSGSGTSIGTDGASTWASPAPSYSPFIRATVTAGALTSGPVGSWTPISTAPSFGQTVGSTSASATVTFEISTNASGGPIVWQSAGNILARGP